MVTRLDNAVVGFAFYPCMANRTVMYSPAQRRRKGDIGKFWDLD